jgi:hypothetical protein
MNKKHIFYILFLSFVLCLGFCICSKKSISAEAFINGVEDIPLVSGFEQQSESGVSFDSPNGRFFDTYLKSDSKNYEEIFTFYGQTLPELGWKKTKKTGDYLEFLRDGEKLLIEVLSQEKPCVVRISITSL